MKKTNSWRLSEASIRPILMIAIAMIAAIVFFGAGRSVVNAEDAGSKEIEVVDIDAPVPVEGNHIHPAVIISASDLELDSVSFDTDTALFDGNNIYGVGYSYKTDPNSDQRTYVKENETFEYEKLYQISVALKANYGYKFTDSTMFRINGNVAYVEGSIGTGDKVIISLLYNDDTEKPIKSLTIDVDDPVSGETVYAKCTEVVDPEALWSSEIENGSSCWEKLKKGDSNWEVITDENEEFQPNYSYRFNVFKAFLGFEASIEEREKDLGVGYGFAEDFQVKFRESLYYEYDFDQYEFSNDGYYNFGVLVEYLGDITVKNIIPPIAGETPSYSATVGDKKRYMIDKTESEGYYNNVCWQDITNGIEAAVTLNEDSIFEAGHKYKIDFFLRSIKTDGYQFDPDKTKIIINGKEAEAEFYNSPYNPNEYNIAYVEMEYTCKAANPLKSLDILLDPIYVGDEITSKQSLETDPKNALGEPIIEFANDLKPTDIWCVKNENGKWQAVEEGSKFEAGKTYGYNASLISLFIFTNCNNEAYFADGITGLADDFVINVSGNSYYSANGKDLDNIIADLLENAVFEIGQPVEKPVDPDQPVQPDKPVQPEQPVVSEDGPLGPGSDLAVAEAAIFAQKNEKDPKGSSYAALNAKAAKTAKSSVTLKWNKAPKAEGYVVYGAKCGKNAYTKLADVKNTTFTQKKLKKGTYYKYIVVAYKTEAAKNGGTKQVVVASSKVIHAATTNGKVTNVKSVKFKNVKKNKKTLKKNKTFTLKTKVVKAKKKLAIKNHRKISYESSNPAIAIVNAKGKVKAVGKGSCYIYVYAQNGVSTKVKITVK